MVKRNQKEKRQIVRRFIKKTGFSLSGASVEVERLTNNRFSPGSFSTAKSRKTHSDKLVNSILRIQEGNIPNKRRLRKASTVNPQGKKIRKQEKKKPKKDRFKKRGKKGTGKLGSATSLCWFYRLNQKKENVENHVFTFRYRGKGASRQGLRSSARRTHRIFEGSDHQFIRWVRVELI